MDVRNDTSHILSKVLASVSVLSIPARLLDIVQHRAQAAAPLACAHRYPLRTPEEAWQCFKEGRARSFNVDDLSPPHGGTIERFTQIELAYAEMEVITLQQIMQPYYVFHADTGQTLYVPAVADPYVRWP